VNLATDHGILIMPHHARFLIVVLTLVALCSGAPAAAALDTATIQRWIDAAGELQLWSDAAADDDTSVFDGAPGDFADARMPTLEEMRTGYVEALGRHPDGSRIIRRHGFGSVDQWADVSARITVGMMAISMEGANLEIDTGMAELMRELENNPDIPAAQRDMVMRQMQQALGITQQISDSARPEDLPAIRTMRGALEQVLDFDSD
jgi:hypothetical protein